MNPSKSPEDILKGIFPILVVLIVLIAGVIVMPSLTADPRSRASEPAKTVVTPTTTRPTFPPQNNTIKPEIVCSDLYSPVCDTKTNTTFPNSCEANLAGIFNTTKGECGKTAPILLPATN